MAVAITVIELKINGDRFLNDVDDVVPLSIREIPKTVRINQVKLSDSDLSKGSNAIVVSEQNCVSESEGDNTFAQTENATNWLGNYSNKTLR